MRTRQLYYEDTYQREFTAKVLECRPGKQGFEICLDQTCFYPEGGGQPFDLGTLNDVPVMGVHEKEGEIWHETEIPFSLGETVQGKIDWERRFDLMQQHSGEHIVSGLIHGKYGLENVGFHLTTEMMTIDLSGSLTMEQLRGIEREANARVWENSETVIWVPSAEELAVTPYRSKKALTGDVRLVRFVGSDCCACCGTHVARTGEIGLIRILSCQKNKSGVRVELRCGARALAYAVECAEQNHKVGVALSVSESGTAEAVTRLQEELGAVKFELVARMERELLSKAEKYRDAGDVLVFEDDLTPDQLRKLAVAVMEICGGRCAAFSGTDAAGYKYAIGEQDGDVRALVKALNGALQGRGGGKPFFAQGSVAADRAAIEAFFAEEAQNRAQAAEETPAGCQTLEKPHVGVVGVGQIGADMATLLLAYGHPVTLVARSMEKAEAGRERVVRDMDDMIRYGKLGENDKVRLLKGLNLSDNYESLAGCAVVIEAVTEEVEVKQTVYEKIEACCPPETIILSETSGIPAEVLAARMTHPERFLVAHSWNPPHVIPLVEAVRAPQTSEETVAKAAAFLESLDRRVVVLRKSVPGFIGNRIQHAMYREALELIEAGVATPAEIDKAVYYSFGQRFSSVGLLEYYDSCGLDLQMAVQSYLLAELSDAKTPQKPLTDCLAEGKLGAKSGQGLYDWSKIDPAEFRDRKCRPFLNFVNWKSK